MALHWVVFLPLHHLQCDNSQVGLNGPLAFYCCAVGACPCEAPGCPGAARGRPPPPPPPPCLGGPPPALLIGLGISTGSTNNPINISAITIPARMDICLLPLFFSVSFFLLHASFRHAGSASSSYARRLLLHLQAQ